VSGAFEGRGELIQRRKSLVAGMLLFVVVAGVMMYFRAPAWAVFVELGLAFALMIAFSVDDYRMRREGSLRGDPQGLWFNGSLVVARRKIETAYLLATERPMLHVVIRPWSLVQPFDVALETEVQAGALLEAIGFSLNRSVATFRAAYGAWWWAAIVILLSPLALVWVAGALVSFLGVPLSLIAGEILCFALMVLVAGRISTRVDVGSDGILLRRLGQRRFISYRALEGASVRGRLILLTLRTRERIRLDLMGTFSEQARSSEALAQRIEEARAAFGEDSGTSTAEAWVAPGGRPAASWLREVRALARARDYREARMDAERLWRVVTDPGAPPATRAGAAIALTGNGDADARSRLRVAADTCADPRLRVALGRVAEGAADVELVEALDSLMEAAASRTDRP
jgi:hypothetical protein